ncbi:ATPase family associated with various cellular activities (AAA) [Carpediemonas membranifera]|uniref:ATPase family associated with various cellular activities (AAA) n=1 Tax=Carpediemonas membranifera TaxID=201153 RepID=A0A8J6B0K7_9EUKA|nr:ATPase family associated with various cellular activities (AAA) [Carpediemonas membranifera]|eukprot:KAG9390437.1 ATPase family associated with various cellular activities (AAA) [Carpediemonas membranifera]
MRAIDEIIRDLDLGNQAVDVANFDSALTFYNAVNARIAAVSTTDTHALTGDDLEKLKMLRGEVSKHISLVQELQSYAHIFSDKPKRPTSADAALNQPPHRASPQSFAKPARRPNQRVAVNTARPRVKPLKQQPKPVKQTKPPARPPRAYSVGKERREDSKRSASPASRPPLSRPAHRAGRASQPELRGNELARGRDKGSIASKVKAEATDEGPGEFRCSPDEQAMAAVIEGTMIRPDQKDSLNVKMEDIVGSKDAKRAIEQAVCYPILAPKLLGLSVTPFRGVLMFGPPGTGKTLLAKAVAAQSDATMFICSSADLTSKFRGESEKLIKLLFAMARHYAPSVIFIDEVDALISNNAGGGDSGDASRRAVSEFQTQMEGVLTPQGDKPVVLIGATNYPWNIRPAMLRRFDKRVYVPLPTVEDVENILRKKMQRAVDDRSIADIDGIDFKALAARLDGYSGSDVDVICRNVCIKPMDRAVEMFGIGKITEMVDGDGMDRSALLEQVGKVTMDDFEVVIEEVEPSVDKALLTQYEEFNNSKKSA